MTFDPERLLQLRLGVWSAVAATLLIEERTGAQPLPDEVRAAAAELAAASGREPDAAGLCDDHARAALRAMWLQARAVLDEGPRGWQYTDPELLRQQGSLSGGRMVRWLSDDVFPTMEGLTGRLSDGGRVLDVGCGAGTLSLALAEHWPGCTVVGIDRHQPALRLAEEARAAAGAKERVSFVDADATSLSLPGPWSLLWIPYAFLSQAAVTAVLEYAACQLEPRGWALCWGGRTGPPDAAQRFRSILWGGDGVTGDEVVAALGRLGFTGIRPLPPTAGSEFGFIVAQAPAARA